MIVYDDHMVKKHWSMNCLDFCLEKYMDDDDDNDAKCSIADHKIGNISSKDKWLAMASWLSLFLSNYSHIIKMSFFSLLHILCWRK